MAQLIKADGTTQDYPPPANGTTYSLAEMQQAIGGGYIQIVATNDGRPIVLEEEGKLKGMRLNVATTELNVYGAADPIVGDALVCDPSQIH